MRLTFLGTKGYIEESSPRHQYHSSLLVTYKKYKLLLDHGVISKSLATIKPNAIVITHGHPDTFKWVAQDENYEGPMYVTKETKALAKFCKNFQILPLRKWFTLGPLRIYTYPVVHSLRAPAVGFKIAGGGKTIIYNSDLVVPYDKNVYRDGDLYIGDGSSVRGNLVRRKGNKLYGHARMQTQINWCKEYGITKIIFTHLGKEAVELGDRKVVKLVTPEGKLVAPEGPEITVAYDGMRANV